MADCNHTGDSLNGEFLPVPKSFSTAAIHAFQEPDQWESMAVVAPLSVSTTFKQHSPANYKKYDYSRSNNPTREMLENCLARLEEGKYGLSFSSGLGAITTVFGMFESGDHVLIECDVYGGTNRLFRKVLAKFGLEIDFICTLNLENVEKHIKPNTKLIWIETPTNPTLKVIDIKAISAIAKQHDILLAVDNTFLSPYFQRPLTLGADLCVHSISKYINGHSDVIMGAILLNNDELYEKLRFLQNSMGIVPSPFDCFQVLRSLKTLAVRMRQHSKSSLIIAKYLAKHPKVEKVLHPALSTHPQYDIMKKQTSGHSGTFSFYLKGGLNESKKFLCSLKLFTLAESLGGYESLIELPSVMTHASVPEDQRIKLNITDNLIRLSVGLEDCDDLIEDLEQAFLNI